MVGSVFDRQPEAEKNDYRLAVSKAFANSRIDSKLSERRTQQSRIACESSLFKENIKDLLLFSSKFPSPDEKTDYPCARADDAFARVKEPNIFLDFNKENRSEESHSPQPRSFCQPVFEEEPVSQFQAKPELERKPAKANPERKGDHSMLALLLNNPLGDVSKKRKADDPHKPSTAQVSGRISTLRSRCPPTQTPKPVKITAVRSKTPLAAKDLNSQSGLRQSTAESLVSRLAKQSKLADYEIGKVIAKGSYSIVKQALQKGTNQQVAIKFYENCKLSDLQKRAGVNKEIAALKLLDHPNIIGLVEDFSSRTHSCIVMELTTTSTLYQYLKSKDDRKLSCKGSPFLPRISICLWPAGQCSGLYAFKRGQSQRPQTRKHYLRWLWKPEADRLRLCFYRQLKAELVLRDTIIYGA
jgi:hypothetical protein